MLGSFSWMPYVSQGVKVLDDDVDKYLMENFLIISSDNALFQGKSFYFNTLSSLGSYGSFQ
jgi:hypothetical protein